MKNAEYDVLDIILKNGGEITFPEFQYGNVEPFIRLRAVEFTEEYDDSKEQFDIEDDCTTWAWNKYCDRIQKAIGSEYCCAWIGWCKEQGMKGLITAYTLDGREVKLKYFEDRNKNWNKLLKHLKTKLCL